MTMTDKTQNIDLKSFIKEIQHIPNINDTLSNLNTSKYHASLFCLCLRYGQQGGGKLTVNQLKALIDVFDHWQQSIIHNLSQLNNCVKNLNSSCVQADAKALVEFAKEAGIGMLEESTPNWAPIKKSNNQLVKDSCLNIARYIKLSRTTLSEALEQNLLQLISTAYQNQDPNFIKETFMLALKKAKIPTQDYQQLSLTDL